MTVFWKWGCQIHSHDNYSSVQCSNYWFKIVTFREIAYVNKHCHHLVTNSSMIQHLKFKFIRERIIHKFKRKIIKSLKIEYLACSACRGVLLSS